MTTPVFVFAFSRDYHPELVEGLPQRTRSSRKEHKPARRQAGIYTQFK
jgi:hypothetical protein